MKRKEKMKPNSLVMYVGGQCEPGKVLYPLSKTKVYTVERIVPHICENTGRTLPFLFPVETDGYSFLATMFVGIDPPKEINLEEILTVETWN